MTYRESTARSLPKHHPGVDPAIRPQSVGGDKVIAFSDASVRGARPASNMRRSRMVRRASLEWKVLVTYPQYLSVALLLVFFYLRLALFADAPFAALHLLWLGAYGLAGISLLNTRRLKRHYSTHSGEDGYSAGS